MILGRQVAKKSIGDPEEYQYVFMPLYLQILSLDEYKHIY